MYCICSEKSIDQILAEQKAQPLPLDELLARYTSCFAGCGSCIEPITERLKEEGLLIERPGAAPVRASEHAVP